MAAINHGIYCIPLLALLTVSTAFAEGKQNDSPPPVVITPESLHWQAFDGFPPGAEAAVLAGNPHQAEPFMLRVKVPPNYIVPPNWQSTRIFVTVLSGQYSIGVGDKFNDRNGKTLPSKGSVVVPANTHLYFWSRKGAILEVHGVGPWEIHYLDPATDPRN
jgi:hypothetical protein